MYTVMHILREIVSHAHLPILDYHSLILASLVIACLVIVWEGQQDDWGTDC